MRERDLSVRVSKCSLIFIPPNSEIEGKKLVGEEREGYLQSQLYVKPASHVLVVAGGFHPWGTKL